jgi:septal ring factor EnvC (AmiA/AmiB activator)
METLAIVIASIVSGIIGAVGKALVDSRKQKDDHGLSANEQAIGVYRNLFEKLEKQLANVTENQEKLEEEFLTSRENNVELRVTNKHLLEKIKLLENELLALKKTA